MKPAPIAFPPEVGLAVARFALSWTSIHGPDHWARVLENGLRLAASTGADPRMVGLFAVFHDACRVDDGSDLRHGPRAALWVRELDLGLTTDDLRRLMTALAGHTTRLHADDPTIATCWDADRLDIGRVGAVIDPAYLSTAAARDPAIIAWAQERGRHGRMPAWVPAQVRRRD